MEREKEREGVNSFYVSILSFCIRATGVPFWMSPPSSPRASFSLTHTLSVSLTVSVSLYSLKLMVVATKRQITLPKFQNNKKVIENEQLYLKSWNSFRPRSFLVGGYEGCIGPSGKLFVYDKSQNFMHHTHGTIPYLFGPYDWSVCSSPSTKEIHVLAVRFILVFSSCNIICGIRTYDLGFSVHYL